MHHQNIVQLARRTVPDTAAGRCHHRNGQLHHRSITAYPQPAQHFRRHEGVRTRRPQPVVHRTPREDSLKLPARPLLRPDLSAEQTQDQTNRAPPAAAAG